MIDRVKDTALRSLWVHTQTPFPRPISGWVLDERVLAANDLWAQRERLRHSLTRAQYSGLINVYIDNLLAERDPD